MQLRYVQASPLLTWTQDDILASRSGYHVIADYLDAPRLVLPRRDPSSGWPQLRSRVLRRFSFSRWCVGGSFDLEDAIRAQHADKPVHFLWCDRDLAFLDRSSQPLIGTFHQCANVLDQIIRRPASLTRFAAIILMSDTQRAWFRQRGVNDQRLHRILHGVDTNYFCPQRPVSCEAFTVLAVGGTRRDFAMMRDVAHSLRDDSSIRFEIVGPADKKQPFIGLENVTYHDRLSDAELLTKYQRASCLLHLIEDSTANNVINEALACGTPVISQRVGGVPEYVTSDCAILCEPGSGKNVVTAIRLLASSCEQQHSMQLAARQHALTLDWRNIAAQTQAIYQQALQR